MTIDGRIEFLVQSIESHYRQIGELTGQVGELTKAITKLVAVSNEDWKKIGKAAKTASLSGEYWKRPIRCFSRGIQEVPPLIAAGPGHG